jgi:hypothetical protein
LLHRLTDLAIPRAHLSDPEQTPNKCLVLGEHFLIFSAPRVGSFAFLRILSGLP